MRYFYGLLIFCSVVFWSSCRNDFETVPSTGNLSFSKDTVYLDTVFSNIGSSTYNLKVYNNSKQDIHIPSVRLGHGEASAYRLNVDGVPGKTFENVEILAKDSIFIFIETTIDIQNLPGNDLEFLYTDQIVFDSGGRQQHVDLVTLVKDAVFLYPKRFSDGTTETISLGTGSGTVEIPGFFLEEEYLTFTNEKPYVIYGFAAVPASKTLTVEAGARVHFHSESGIMVAPGASIHAMGMPSLDPELQENEIIFTGDRLEPAFADIPGQWGFIWLTDGSTGNEFHHTTIKNATVGLMIDNSPASLKNVQIYNNSNMGILARTGAVYGENLVINNSGQASLAIQLGGSYEFNHATFANYWTGSFRNFPSVYIDNSLETEDAVYVADLLQADFTNCIIYGNDRREFFLKKNDQAAFNFRFRNSLIRFEDRNGQFDEDPLYDFSNTDYYSEIKLNADPVFQNPSKNNFNIEKDESAAEKIGLDGVPPAIDLNGTLRTNPPDAGAFQAVTFPED